MSRPALTALAILALLAAPGSLEAQCYEEVNTTCPLRNEVTIGVGPSTQKLAVSVAWTSTRRFGAYARLFPALDPDAPAQANATVTSEEASEFGLTYRLFNALTLGAGYGRYQETVRSFGAVDPVTFRPTLSDEDKFPKAGPSLFFAYTFAPPRRQIGFAITASGGAVGSGVSIATSLHFLRGGATPGVK